MTATGTCAGPIFRSLDLTVHTRLAADLVAPLLEPARRVCYVSNTLGQAPDVAVKQAAPITAA